MTKNMQLNNQKAMEHISFCNHGNSAANMILCEMDTIEAFFGLDASEWASVEQDCIDFIKYCISNARQLAERDEESARRRASFCSNRQDLAYYFDI